MINDMYYSKIFKYKYILGNIREETIKNIYGVKEKSRGIL
jgi:hypothetical protein